MKVFFPLRNSFFFFLPLAAIFFSCVSPRVTEESASPRCSRDLTGTGIKSEKQLADFFASRNPDYPYEDVLELAALYIKEGADEHINSDVAFVQMCLETGCLRFGRIVTADMHNYCGLGSQSELERGASFETAELGVRAHIQHLQAYATDESVPLTKELVDPRYGWVHKALSAKTIFDLSNQWAPEADYGDKLERLLTMLDAF